MYALTTTLFLLSASALLVQAGTIPKEEQTAAALATVGVSIKTGEEGYITTVQHSKADKSDLKTNVQEFFKADLMTKLRLVQDYFGAVKKAAKNIVWPVGLKIFAGAKLLSFVLIWGLLATHTVCKFTSLCAFSMNLPALNKENILSRLENTAKPYMSKDKMEYTLALARSAIDNYISVQENM